MRITHVTIGVDGRLRPWEDMTQRHAAIRRLAKVQSNELGLFNLVPDHAHAVSIMEERSVADFRRSSMLALGASHRSVGL